MNYDKINARLETLRNEAVDLPYSKHSEKALFSFLKNVKYRPLISMLDTYDLRAVWKSSNVTKEIEDKEIVDGEQDPDYKQIGITFLGGDKVQFVLFADNGATMWGRNNFSGVMKNIEANGLNGLLGIPKISVENEGSSLKGELIGPYSELPPYLGERWK